jgi:hypothetical protein
MLRAFRRWWDRVSGRSNYQKALETIELEREELARMSLAQAEAEAERLAEDRSLFHARLAPGSEWDPAPLESTAPPSVRSWFTRHPVLVGAGGVYDVIIAPLRSARRVDGHLCVGADMDGGEFFVSTATGEVVLVTTTVEGWAPSIFHFVIRIAREQRGSKPEGDAEDR